MSTAYANLKKHLELAIRQLKEILNKEKDFNEKELTDYENQIYRDQGSPRRYSKSVVEDCVQPKG